MVPRMMVVPGLRGNAFFEVLPQQSAGIAKTAPLPDPYPRGEQFLAMAQLLVPLQE